MSAKPERPARFQSYLMLVCLAGLLTLSVVLLHSQTDVWHHISSYIADRQVSQFYPPQFAVINSSTATDSNRTEAPSYHIKNNSDGVQQIPRVTAYVDGVAGGFELVEGISSNIYIYSALWDVEFVRLESILVQGYKFERLLCVLYYTMDTTRPDSYVKPVVKELHTYKSPYTGGVVKCPVKPGVHNGNVPVFVGLVEKEFDLPKQTFYIENLNKNTGTVQEFTVCVPPLFRMNSTALVIQKVEMIKFFGAGRVVFYNHSISPSVDSALRLYTQEWKEGKAALEVVTLPWKIPEENGKPIKIPYFAQQLGIDECMYRYKYLSKYMVFNDLDEYMVPLKHANWSELIADRLRLQPKGRVWLFRSTVLNRDRPSPAKGYEEEYKRYASSILGLTSRDQYVFPASHRAKTIIDPRAVEEKAIHRVWDNQGLTDNLPVDVGLLFHYRMPLNKCSPQVKETRIVDRYGERLLARMREVWAKLPGAELGYLPVKDVDKNTCEKS